jgi:hypothetical protein
MGNGSSVPGRSAFVLLAPVAGLVLAANSPFYTTLVSEAGAPSLRKTRFVARRPTTRNS